MESWKQEMIENNSLTHHGILGQKWGVRRFQNYDGTYTQRGLKRYNKAEKRYDNDLKKYESVKKTKDKEAIKKQKARLSEAKRELIKEYKNLKNSKLADEGRKLTEKGYTDKGRFLGAGLASMGLILNLVSRIADSDDLIDPGKSKVYDFMQKHHNAFTWGTFAAAVPLTVAGTAIGLKSQKVRAYQEMSKTKKE